MGLLLSSGISFPESRFRWLDFSGARSFILGLSSAGVKLFVRCFVVPKRMLKETFDLTLKIRAVRLPFTNRSC